MDVVTIRGVGEVTDVTQKDMHCKNKCKKLSRLNGVPVRREKEERAAYAALFYAYFS